MKWFAPAAVLAAAAFALHASDWPFYRHDAQGSSNPGETLTADQVAGLQPKWFAPIGIIANPVVAGGRVFLVGTDGALHALNATNGVELWRHASPAHGPFHCFAGSTSTDTRGPVGAPAVVGNTVYMPGGDGTVYAHDVATGAIRWQTSIASVAGAGDFLWSSAYPIGNRLYFGIASLHDCVLVPGRVVALDQATGQVVGVWRGDGGYNSGAGVWTTPAYDARTNRMFVTTGTIAPGVTAAQQPLADAFVAIDPGTLATVDHFTPVSGDYYADVDFGASPALFDTAAGRHLIAATNKNGWVYALDRDNLAGGVVWTHQISAFLGDPDAGLSSIVSPVYANGSLFVGGTRTTDGYSGAVAALDPATGAAKWLWHPPNGRFVLGALSVAGNMLLVPGTTTIASAAGGTLYILDQSTGHVLWSKDTAQGIFSQPTFANGVLYFGDLTTGVWAYAAPSAPPPPPPPPPPGVTLFHDDFNRTALGSSWNVAHGAFADDGAAAIGTGAQSYAFWTGSPEAAASVSVTISSPTAQTYYGALARALPSSPDANHYTGFVGDGGVVAIARRNAGTYTVLAIGPVFPAGSHVLTFQAAGANPVVLTVQLDGVEVVRATDSSAQAFTTAGLAGIFDYYGTRQRFDDFTVAAPSGGTDGGTSDGGTDGGSVDGGTGDGGTGDGGTGDAGTGDGGTSDGGSGDGGTGDGGVAFHDDFNRTALGSSWTVAHGAFGDDGAAAIGTAAQSYAFWTGTPDATASVSVTISPPTAQTYYGALARALPSSPDANHYTGFVGDGGHVAIARRNGGTYTVLAIGPVFPAGSHVMTFQAAGANPVVLTVQVDGAEVVRATDSSAQAFTTAGLAGIFDFNGTRQRFDDFTVSGQGTTTTPPSNVVASDEFAGSGPLANGWTVWGGSFSVSSGRAIAGAAQSYATKGPAVSGDVSVSAVVDPAGRDYVGVIARANGAVNHYVAWLNHDGSLHLARRNDYVYTYLADATPGLTGAHQLQLVVRGTGPVHLAILADGNPILDYVDSAANALTAPGTGGIFSYAGAGPTYQHFLETNP